MLKNIYSNIKSNKDNVNSVAGVTRNIDFQYKSIDGSWIKFSKMYFY